MKNQLFTIFVVVLSGLCSNVEVVAQGVYLEPSIGFGQLTFDIPHDASFSFIGTDKVGVFPMGLNIGTTLTNERLDLAIALRYMSMEFRKSRNTHDGAVDIKAPFDFEIAIVGLRGRYYLKKWLSVGLGFDYLMGSASIEQHRWGQQPINHLNLFALGEIGLHYQGFSLRYARNKHLIQSKGGQNKNNVDRLNYHALSLAYRIPLTFQRAKANCPDF